MPEILDCYRFGESNQNSQDLLRKLLETWLTEKFKVQTVQCGNDRHIHATCYHDFKLVFDDLPNITVSSNKTIRVLNLNAPDFFASLEEMLKHDF